VLSKRKADPEVFRALVLLRDIQEAGAVGIRVEPGPNNQPSTVLFILGERVEPEIQARSTN